MGEKMLLWIKVRSAPGSRGRSRCLLWSSVARILAKISDYVRQMYDFAKYGYIREFKFKRLTTDSLFSNSRRRLLWRGGRVA